MSNPIQHHLDYWRGISECECASPHPTGACLYCDMGEIQKDRDALLAAKNKAVKLLKGAVDTISSHLRGMYVIGASDREIAEYERLIEELEKV